MIEVRCKGIPMRADVRVEDGYHVFTLDEAQHDAGTVLHRMMRACGQSDLVQFDAVHDAIMAARECRCQAVRCESPGECRGLRRCAIRLR